jgi:hypothetical protein
MTSAGGKISQLKVLPLLRRGVFEHNTELNIGSVEDTPKPEFSF